MQSEIAVVVFLQPFIYKLCFYGRQQIRLVIFGIFATFLSPPGNCLRHFWLYLEIICYYFIVMTACSTHMHFLNSDAPLYRTLLAFWPHAILYQHVLTFVTAHRRLRQFAQPVKQYFRTRRANIATQGANFVAINDSSCFWRFSSSLPSHQMALPFEDNTVLSLTQVFFLGLATRRLSESQQRWL